MTGPGSVTHLVEQAKAGDHDAFEKLWELYFPRLAGLARKKLKGKKLVNDEEDVALSAMDSFFRRAELGKFELLHDRNDLWRLLVKITVHKVLDLKKHEGRLKRGGGNVLGESAMTDVIAKTPSPAFLAEAAEQFDRLLDLLKDDPTLQVVAVRKLEGFTNEDIAAELDRVPSTVERKLRRIREIWSKEIPS